MRQMTRNKSLLVIFFLFLGVEMSYLLWLGVKKALGMNLELSEDPLNTVLFFDSGSPECYYNHHNADKCKRKNCAPRNTRFISNLLENAKKSIDMCMYKLSEDSFGDSLRKAIKNHVKVRVLVDGDIGEHSKVLMKLQQSGAFVRGRKYENLHMHHKFVVIDNTLVITGSLNWTKTSISGNWEDVAVLSEPSIVQKFSDEFQYLLDNVKTAVIDWPAPVNRRVFPSNLSVWKETTFNEVFFFRADTAACKMHMKPWDFDQQPPDHIPLCAFSTSCNLAELLRTAEKSVYVCQLLINLTKIADVFLDASKRGLDVRVVSDMQGASQTGSKVEILIKGGIEIRGKHHHAKMHHKFIILDKKLVFFGSFNFTLQALCGNAESLVCTNNSEIVNKFCEHFDGAWNAFEPIEVDKIGKRSFMD